jgi:hypothetical protein
MTTNTARNLITNISEELIELLNLVHLTEEDTERERELVRIFEMALGKYKPSIANFTRSINYLNR